MVKVIILTCLEVCRWACLWWCLHLWRVRGSSLLELFYSPWSAQNLEGVNTCYVNLLKRFKSHIKLFLSSEFKISFSMIFMKSFLLSFCFTLCYSFWLFSMQLYNILGIYSSGWVALESIDINTVYHFLFIVVHVYF